MSYSKSQLLFGITITAMVGCGGGTALDPEPTEVSPSPDAPSPIEILGGGVATPVHEGQAGSPHVKVDWEVDSASISITYGRPFLRGRTGGDTVEPLDGSVWRLGADEATTLNTSSDLMVGSAHVPAGEYTLWTLTTGDTTELIIINETGQWGTAYDESRDLGRTAMTVSTLDIPADQLTLSIEDSQLRFEWGNMVASVPIMVH